MTDLKTLQTYENWKVKKQQRKTWMAVIAFFLALILAYISGNLLCKVGLTETKKPFSYGWGTSEEELKTENQSKFPSDYLTTYKKIKENIWQKQFGRKENYYTKGEIAKREAKKKGEDWGILGDIASWWLSKGLSEEEAKKVDYYQYANYVYSFTSLFLIISWLIFYVVYYLLLRYLILPLIWKEPEMVERVDL